MALIPAKCPDCGGLIEVNSEKKAANCQFCGNAFIVEEAIQNFNTVYNITNNYNTTNVTNNNTNIGEGAIVNIYEDKSKDFVIEAGVLVKYNGAAADVVVPDGVTEIDENCFKELKIKSVKIPDTVTTISRFAFYDCSELVTVTIPNSVTYIGQGAFCFCSKLSEITLPKGLKSIDDSAFSYCNSLTSIIIPDSVKSIGNGAFRNCENLATVTIPNKLASIQLKDLFEGTKYYQQILAVEEKKREHESKEMAKKLVPEIKKIAKAKGLISAYDINSIGNDHTIGLKSNGRVIAVGNGNACSVSGLTDIVAISTGATHTVGLKSDGTVAAAGYNNFGQCNTANWKDIVAISAGAGHTVGLKSNGTVVATGKHNDISEWTNIITITSTYDRIYGLKSNGTVVGVGCSILEKNQISKWTNIVDISSGGGYIVGLKADGTVVTTANFGDRYTIPEPKDYISKWKDIVAVSIGESHAVGLKSNGTVVAVGSDVYNQCKVLGWKDIVAVSAGYNYTIGLKSDGTVIATGDNTHGQCSVGGWKLFDNFENLEEERKIKMSEIKKKLEQQAQYRSQGLCQHCGGELKGFIGKKCVKCGKSKDY